MDQTHTFGQIPHKFPPMRFVNLINSWQQMSSQLKSVSKKNGREEWRGIFKVDVIVEHRLTHIIVIDRAMGFFFVVGFFFFEVGDDERWECVKQGVAGAGTWSPTKTTEASLPTQHPEGKTQLERLSVQLRIFIINVQPSGVIRGWKLLNTYWWNAVAHGSDGGSAHG